MSEPFQRTANSYYTIQQWMQMSPSLIAGYTTRKSGLSNSPYQSLNLGLHVGDHKDNVINNRIKLSSQISFPLNEWVCAEQVHGSNILKVTSEHIGRGTIDLDNAVPGVDGLYTKEQGILLTACFADCVSLFYFAPNQQLIGIAHAGWKGTVKKIAARMAETWFKHEKVQSDEIYVTIGPSICAQCYEVDERVIQQVDSVVMTQERPYQKVPNKDNKYLLDLKELNKKILINAGILKENIQVTGLCTSCNNDIFFSHRKENGKTGRMFGFIGYREEQ